MKKCKGRKQGRIRRQPHPWVSGYVEEYYGLSGLGCVLVVSSTY